MAHMNRITLAVELGSLLSTVNFRNYDFLNNQERDLLEQAFIAIESVRVKLAPDGNIVHAAIAKQVLEEMGDQGTCCIGMGLRYKGRKIAEGIVQGNTTNYEYFKRIKQSMIELQDANPDDFKIDHGMMD